MDCVWIVLVLLYLLNGALVEAQGQGKHNWLYCKCMTYIIGLQLMCYVR